MRPFKPKTIFIEKDAEDTAFAKKILRSFPKVPRQRFENPKYFLAEFWRKKDPIGEGKKYILISKHKGRMLRPCPSTKNYICCGYKILHLGSGCNLNCTYCILQSYLNNPLLTIFANWRDALNNLKTTLDKHPNQFFRIGTGEFMDSLTLDPLTKLSSGLVPFFAKRKNAILELKTKTTNIENLRKLQHGGRTVASWSLNSRSTQQGEEYGGSDVLTRIEAARKCVKWGYPIGFHFDPIILHKDWRKEYKKVIDRIFERIPESRIVWISMGCFRFMPPLKSIITKRFPKSSIPYGEFVRGLDDKMRYFKPLRIEAYQALYERIRSHSEKVPVYLCMESDEVWRKSLGWSPKSTRGLARYLDNAAKHILA